MKSRRTKVGWNPDIELSWLSNKAPSNTVKPQESLHAFHEYGRAQAVTFTEDVEQIDTLVRSTHPLPLLACFSTFFLTSLLPKKLIDKDVPVVQAHGELLQAVLLRHRLEDFEWREHPSAAIDPIGRCLISLTRAFSAKRLAGMVSAEQAEQYARQFVTEIVRGTTQLTRNWGYSYQTFRVLEGLFQPLADDLSASCGASVSDILHVWTGITKTVESDLAALLESVRKARSELSWELFIERLTCEYPIPDERLERIRGTVNASDKAVALEAAVFLCLELLLPTVYLFTWNRLRDVSPTNLSEASLRSLLERWSCCFGDLADSSIEHYFLNNPVWRRPLIRLDEQTWFVPMPHLFFSFGWDLLADILRPDAVAFARYSRRRASYLEKATAAEFEAAFPMANVFVGNVWTDPIDGKEYENDVLVEVDAFVFVIEAKAGMVHETARRGAPARLEQVIKDLIVTPARQSKRFAEFLQGHAGVARFRSKDGTERELDMTGVRRVLSYSMTLDVAGDVGVAQSELRRTGWIPADVILPPSMTLSDLQNIFELLDGYCPKLHYLMRRAELQRNARFVADELDLLALYLDGQFNFGDAEFDGTWLMAYGCSAVFEKYFLEKEQGRQPRKPRLKLSRWWSNILSVIDHRLPKMWSILGTDLLSVPLGSQQRFGKLMLRARTEVLKGRGHRRDRVLMVTEPTLRPVAIAGVSYVDRTRDERDTRLVEASRQVRFPDGRWPDRVVVLGCDPRLRGHPYSVIMLAEFEREARPGDHRRP